MATKILIVEDDNNIADLLRLYLEKENYEVCIAPDGGKGVEQFRRFQPDLVLLDLMLPVLDGWGVCRTIRAESSTPIIMLTAKGELDDKISGLKQGADDYITKPFEMQVWPGWRPCCAAAAASRRRTASAWSSTS